MYWRVIGCLYSFVSLICVYMDSINTGTSAYIALMYICMYVCIICIFACKWIVLICVRVCIYACTHTIL